MRCLPTTLLAGLLLAVPPAAHAQAESGAEQPRDERRNRFAVASEFGMEAGRHWVDGQKRPSEGSDLYGGLRLEGTYTLPRRLAGDRLDGFGFSGLARVGEWSTVWSTARGESRGRFDLGLGPSFVRGPVFIAVPVGYTAAFIEAGPGRAVEEEYATGQGFHYGVMAGYDLARRTHGLHVGVGLTSHVVWAEREVSTPSGATFTEHLRYRDGIAYVSLGYVARF